MTVVAPANRGRATSPGLSEDTQAKVALCNSCLGRGLTDSELGRLRDVTVGRGVCRLGHLFRTGDTFCSLYVLISGLMKRVALSVDGREHVVGVDFPGDLLGFEGIDSGAYRCDVVALRDSLLWRISYARLKDLALELPSLERNLDRAMSQQIVLGNRQMMLLGSMGARERVAILLLMYLQHARARVADACAFDLGLTREEIGNYLGLRLETVSREMQKLAGMGLVKLNGPNVEVLNVDRLASLVGRTVS